MARYKTENELRAAITSLELDYCLGHIVARQFRRRKERMLKEIRRIRQREAIIRGGDTDGTETAPRVPAGMAMS